MLEPAFLGAEVDSTPAVRPQRVTLSGSAILLEPLQTRKHASALFRGSHGQDRNALWRYMSDGPYASEQDFQAAVEIKSGSSDAIFYAIVDRASMLPTGYASLMRIDTANRCVEVGNILYTPALQRTRGATEAMYLLAAYIFDHLGYRRYEWKCNAFNEPSRRAALRYGFTFEGLFRQHMIVKGRNRDTAWFSMLDSEWPARKANFERWLRKDNFDEAGRQLTSLSQLRTEPNEIHG